MKFKINKKPFAVIIYVSNKPNGFAGYTYPFVILINKKYENDIGLLQHELTHIKQIYRTFGLHLFLYLFSKKYRLKAEVEAYRAQLKYSPNSLDKFAMYLSTKYNLNIDFKEAKERISNV